MQFLYRTRLLQGGDLRAAQPDRGFGRELPFSFRGPKRKKVSLARCRRKGGGPAAGRGVHEALGSNGFPRDTLEEGRESSSDSPLTPASGVWLTFAVLGGSSPLSSTPRPQQGSKCT